MKSIIFAIAILLYSTQAAAVTVSLVDFEQGEITLVDPSGEYNEIPYPNLGPDEQDFYSARFIYDPLTRTVSDGQISATTMTYTFDEYAPWPFFMHDIRMTTNDDNSLNVTGLIDYGLQTNMNYSGTWIVNYCDYNECTDFAGRGYGSDYYGMQILSLSDSIITSGIFAGYQVELDYAYFADYYIGHPLPEYSPVPLPGSIFLLTSGLLALSSARKQASARTTV